MCQRATVLVLPPINTVFSLKILLRGWSHILCVFFYHNKKALTLKFQKDIYFDLYSINFPPPNQEVLNFQVCKRELSCHFINTKYDLSHIWKIIRATQSGCVSGNHEREKSEHWQHCVPSRKWKESFSSSITLFSLTFQLHLG